MPMRVLKQELQESCQSATLAYRICPSLSLGSKLTMRARYMRDDISHVITVMAY